jgi:hypothetical protein
MMFKVAEQMEVAGSKVRAIRRMLEISQLLICFVGSLGTSVVMQEQHAWFRQQPKELYAAGFQGLVKRWDKCLNVQADYVEK